MRKRSITFENFKFTFCSFLVPGTPGSFLAIFFFDIKFVNSQRFML